MFLILGLTLFIVMKVSDPSVAASHDKLTVMHASYFINHFIFAFSNAFVFDPIAEVPYTDKLRFFLLVVASCFLLRKKHLFPIVLFSCIALPVVLAVVINRPSTLYYNSDYLYYPVLWCCIIVSMITDALLDRFRQFRILFMLPICLGLLFLVVFQHMKSNNLYSRYGEHSDSIRSSFEQNQKVLDKLASSANRIVRIPNIPIVIDRDTPFCFTSEALVGLMPRELKKKFDVVSVPKIDQAELSHLKLLLQSMETCESQQWIDIIDTIAPDIQSLTEASSWLVQNDHVVALPGFYLISYPELGINMIWESVGLLVDYPLSGFELDFGRQNIDDNDKSLLLSLEYTQINDGGKWQRFDDRAIKNDISVTNYLDRWNRIIKGLLNGIDLYSQPGSHGVLLRYFGKTNAIRVDHLHFADDRLWAVNLTQGDYHVKGNKIYRVKFKARSEAARSIQMGFYSLEDSVPLNVPFQTCLLSEHWTDFEFVIPISVNVRSRLAFNLGGSDAPVEIQQIQVKDDQVLLTPDSS